MVDTYVSGAYGEIRVGSSPIQDIIILSIKYSNKGRRTQPNEVRSRFKRKRAECEGLIANNWKLWSN